MSAISERDNIQFDGLRRFRTSIKVIVHSHTRQDPLHLSDDVVSCRLSKDLKGLGRANLALTPARNYTNLLFPNDVINIYFDRGDGEGWTRTFFGFIDRIEEAYNVDANGMPTTLYHIISTDWQKALEKTEVYFNPQLAGRKDLGGSDFVAEGFNIGGIGMISKGLRAVGPPTDCVTNLLLLQLGFGSQWLLPSAYKPLIDERFVKLRKEYARGRLFRTLQGRLSTDASERLETLVNTGELARIQQETRADVHNIYEDKTRPFDEEAIQTLLVDAGVPADAAAGQVSSIVGNNSSNIDLDAVQALLRTARTRQAILNGSDGPGASTFQAPVNAYFNSIDDTTLVGSSLLDIVNLTDFVERKAVDGFAFDTAVWERQGSLGSIVRSVSNEAMNELIFDMRPMNVNGVLQEGSEWDRTHDEISGNLPDDGGTIAGVRYMPSVIMREFPFATVQSVDASMIQLRTTEADSNNVSSTTTHDATFGTMYFGAVFSNQPNKPGRHIVTIPNINVEDRFDGVEPLDDPAPKHLDVAVISETEITASSLGRSDNDHYNLFELFSDDAITSGHKFFMKDFIPIVSPIHIVRHGLRVRSITTRFARFSARVAQNTQQSPGASPADEAATEETAARLEPTLVPPVREPPPGFKLRFNNEGKAQYGYRHPHTGAFWKFHHGIDIGIAPRVDDKQDIVAIADGYVVCSAPNGVFSYYGNYVVIEHPQFEVDGSKVYSVYAHLANRSSKVGNTRNATDRVDCIAAGHGSPSRRRSNFEKIHILRGEKVGTMGRTAGTDANPNRKFASGSTHLHFEIVKKFPAKSIQTPQIPFTAAGLNPADNYIATFVVPEAGPRPSSTADRSMDPVEFFSTTGGIDMVAAIAALNLSDETAEAEVLDEEGGGEAAPAPGETTPTPEDTPVPADTVSQAQTPTDPQLPGAVGALDSRQQLGRWALLQDHWYQHNLEYLSGTITMRGAPEIRVGYRLDIKERNMSFYVEAVNHQWEFPNEMITTLQVVRGQPNNPYPAYALPPTPGFRTQENARRRTSRLAQYAIVPDPIAVRRAISIRLNTPANGGENGRSVVNELDIPANWGQGLYQYGELPVGFQPGDNAPGLMPAETTDRPIGTDDIASDILADTDDVALEESPSLSDIVGAETNLNTLENGDLASDPFRGDFNGGTSGNVG